MFESNHKINNITFDICVDDINLAESLQEEVSRFMQGKVLLKISAIFDELTESNTWLKIDRLVLDLPPIDYRFFLEELEIQLLKNLRETIYDFKIKTFFDNESTAITNQEMIWLTFLHFIEYGRYPWWFSRENYEVFWNTFKSDESYENLPENYIQLLKNLLINNMSAKERFIFELSVDLKLNLIKLVFPRETDFYSWIKMTYDHIQAANLKIDQVAELNKNMWLLVLNQLPRQNSSQAQWLKEWHSWLNTFFKKSVSAEPYLHQLELLLTDSNQKSNVSYDENLKQDIPLTPPAIENPLLTPRENAPTLQPLTENFPPSTNPNLPPATVTEDILLTPPAIENPLLTPRENSPTLQPLTGKFPPSTNPNLPPATATEDIPLTPPAIEKPPLTPRENAPTLQPLVEDIDYATPDYRTPATNNFPESIASVDFDLFSQISPQEQKTGIYVSFAGLVLLHPFLQSYFQEVRLIQNLTFVDLLAQQKAVRLMYYLVTGQTQSSEHNLVLAKLICDWPINSYVSTSIELDDSSLKEADNLLAAILEHWAVMQNAGIDGLREGFLQREGKLTNSGHRSWSLQVESQPIDILLEQLPWGINLIKLPWMKTLLNVEWR